MKKRFVAAVMCAAMLIATLVGCNDEYVAQPNSVNAMTVVVAMVAEEVPTKEAVELVEEALTDITSQNYNIAVELEFYTPDEYRNIMYKKFEKLQEAYDNDTLGSSIDSGNSYTINEFGRQETKYPDTYENQVDILLVQDSKMLREFADKMWLHPLQGSDCMTSVDGEGTLITKYVPQKIRNLGIYNNGTYAIPGNSIYTDYEYLLVDKALYDEYGTLPTDEISGLDSIKDYLISVANEKDGVIPLYNVTDLGVTGLSDANTVLGQYISDIDQPTVLTDKFNPKSILDLAEVKAQLSVICAIAKEGAQMPERTYDVDFSQSFGACYISGTPDMIEQYRDEYYVVPVSKPLATTETVYSSMYGVSSFSSAPDRAFKVLSLMYTNPEFVNTLLYGVENEHYTLDITKSVVTRIQDSGYNIDRYSVGNAFITKQSTDMTKDELAMSANDWMLAKKATGDLLISPYVGFKLDYTLDPVSGISVGDMETHLEMLFDELWLKISQYPETVDEATGEKVTFDVFYRSLNAWLNSDTYFAAAITSNSKATNSYYNQYIKWYNAMNNIVVEDDTTDGTDQTE